MKWKILIPVSFMFVALVILITVFSVIRFSGYTGILFEERVAVAANGLRRFMDDCEYDTKIAVIAASNDIDIINAVAGHDSAEITASLSQTLEMYHVDFFVVTDDKGIVLSRTLFPDITGDYILNQYNIEEALKGRIVTSMEEDPNVKVSVRTGAPVYNSSGLIIGAISAGVRFDTNEALDRLKDHYNAEFSVFMSGSRIATTIIRNGKRIIDSPLDQNTLDYIHSIKKDYPVNVNILGEDFSAYYMPLFDNRGEVFAIIAAAYSNQKLILERNALQSSIIITGTAGLALFIIMLLLITSGIVKPVNRLADLVSEVTHGNINVNFNNTGALNDEVGFLTHDIHLLVDVIKSILGDLSVLTVDLTNFKNTGHQIDTSKYFGSYREIIEGIKKLSDSISTMRMAMAAMDYLDTMIHVVDFDYNLLYINRIMINTYKMNGNCIGQKCYNAIKGRDTPCPGCHMAELLPDMDIGPYVNYDNIYDEITGRYYGGKSAIIRWVDGKQVLFNSVIDETQKIVYQEQLRKTLLEAEAASIAKSAFLANMSHEIRTPMNSIVGFAELAMDSEVTPITREYLHLIKENAGWLLQIINDILDISKVESGNMKFEIIPFDLHELLNSCRSIMLPRAAEKKIALQFNIDTSIENKLLGDPTKLRQVLLNLLSNAVKFTDTGSVNQFVTVKGKAGKKIDLYFLTQDSGIGMTPEQVEKAMEPFMQADISTTRKYGGTGLGLTITKNLLEMMGSRLVINSEAGRGTSIGFALTLDIAQDTEGEPDAAQGGADAQISRPMYSGEVLVCEDNQMNQRVITEHLARVGLDLEIAGNGLEGIEKVLLRKEKGIKPFDLIFMDIHMPVMDGLETAPQIIALETGTPIVAMTANVTAGEMEKYKAAGMADHLGKPFTSAELWRCLSRYFKPVEKPAAVQTAGSQDTVREDEARDKKLQDELKKDFLNKNKNRIDEIKTALDCGDIKAAHRIAHNLKSNAGLIGMAVLQEVAKQTENQLKDGENCLAPQQLDKLGAELSIVLKDLEQHYGEVQNAEPNSVALSPAEFDPAKAQALFE
ncbi:MAG: ATP-binding protein, partial [Treponema sp.]|nr:ATP-binding protein [Treponema sp.]